MLIMTNMILDLVMALFLCMYTLYACYMTKQRSYAVTSVMAMTIREVVLRETFAFIRYPALIVAILGGLAYWRVYELLCSLGASGWGLIVFLLVIGVAIVFHVGKHLLFATIEQQATKLGVFLNDTA